MKMRRIPETDLARIAGRPEDEQRLLLQRLKGFKPPHTLNPVRRAIPDIMNVQYDLLGRSTPTSWNVIEAAIHSSKESDDGKERNIAVAKAIYNFVAESGVVSYDKPALRWPVGFGNSVEYWQQFYSVWEGRASFVHFDPRQSSPLNGYAMRFAFSMMHERLRVEDPDFSDVDLTIMRFGVADGGERFVKLFNAREFSLYTRDHLNEMITHTYRLWADELARRTEVERKATGTDNPMGF